MDLNAQLALAKQHYDSGRMADCALVIDYVLRRDPNHWQALLVSGQMSYDAKMFGQALQAFLRVAQLEPRNIYCWKMLGHILTVEGHQFAGIKAFEEACKFEGGIAENWVNLAAAFVNLGMPDRIIDAADMALAREPGNCGAEYHKALGLMEKGEWAEGLRLYERRLEMPEALKAKRPYTFPKWDGKPVGKLLLAGEQGLGDEVLFLGWLRDVPAERLVLEVTPRLARTVQRSFPDAQVVSTVEEVIGTTNTLTIGIGGEQSMMGGEHEGAIEGIDAWAHLGSLPHLLGVENRWDGGYMKPDPDRVAHYRAELEKLGPAPYVGLSWSGGRIATHGYLRNAHSSLWKPFTQAATCISVQYGPMGKLAGVELGLPHWQDAIDDIDEMFAILAALDLVISVNNSTVHMCGALGKDCWTLTPSRPAWRYQLHGERMPWYASVKQYRQQADEWESTFVRVAGDLAMFANHRKAA